MTEKLKAFFNHERYQTISIVAVICVLVWFYGCESKIFSISQPYRKINREQLEIEVNAYMAQVELKFQDLDSQDLMRKFVIDQALLYQKTGVLNPVGVLLSVISLAGAGAAIDNVRRRKTEKAKDVSSG